MLGIFGPSTDIQKTPIPASPPSFPHFSMSHFLAAFCIGRSLRDLRTLLACGTLTLFSHQLPGKPASPTSTLFARMHPVHNSVYTNDGVVTSDSAHPYFPEMGAHAPVSLSAPHSPLPPFSRCVLRPDHVIYTRYISSIPWNVIKKRLRWPSPITFRP